MKELGEEQQENQVTEVPKINYENSQEKRNTLQLAFSTLKCNFRNFSDKLFEKIILNVCFII